MSPSLRERLIIGLAPERLTVLRVGGLWRPRIRDRYALTIQAAQSARWDAQIAALEVLLEQPAWSARDLSVIVSSHYVHYAVIPAGRGLSKAERKELAHLVFRNAFGELSEDWELRVSPAGRRPALASAIPNALLTALRDVCGGRGVLRSIQPGMMTLFNQARALIGKKDGTLALVEAGRISLATVEKGSWKSVASRAGQPGRLPQRLAEENELNGHSPGGWLWLCDLTQEVRLPVDSPWTTQLLKPPRGAANGAASLAEWGV